MESDIKIFRFKASTKGGQRANRRETGIKLRYLPTGTEVKVKGRYQSQNLKKALAVLEKRLKLLRHPRKKRIPTRIPKRAEEKRLQAKKYQSRKKHLRRPAPEY